MHHSSNFYILLQYHLYLNDIIQQHIYIYICIYMISFLSLSLVVVGLQASSLQDHCRRQCQCWGVGHHRPFLHSPSSISSSFSRHHLIDLNCCDGRHGWGRSSMLVLLGFILGFDGYNFGGYCGQRRQSMWVVARSMVDLVLDFWGNGGFGREMMVL